MTDDWRGLTIDVCYSNYQFRHCSFLLLVNKDLLTGRMILLDIRTFPFIGRPGGGWQYVYYYSLGNLTSIIRFLLFYFELHCRWATDLVVLSILCDDYYYWWQTIIVTWVLLLLIQYSQTMTGDDYWLLLSICPNWLTLSYLVFLLPLIPIEKGEILLDYYHYSTKWTQIIWTWPVIYCY